MDKMMDEIVSKLVKDIRYGEIKGTYNIVVATINLLKYLINNANWITAKDLIEIIILNGKHLIDAFPLEASIGNMVRRILKIIREEYMLELKKKSDESDFQESLHKLLTAEAEDDVDFNISVPSLKPSLIDRLNEFELELETCSENITKLAPEYIESNDIIMTFGKSTLVEEFLKTAAATKSFEVIVAEGGPSLRGIEMASSLSEAKIQTTLLSDDLMFALMPKISKVIIGAHTVMSNGGLRAISGCGTIARAAKYYSIPLIVLLPLYKLSPLSVCSYKQDGFTKYASPLSGVISGANAALLERVEAYNPVYNYVPSDLVTLFITNMGSNEPSCNHKLISELYHPNDYKL
ncbi:translation initiation factor eIF2B subunit beta [Prorops nasuta]|uniref:translation initiation factor eIF2B subunit beta n=1 Tax=Prorops nasuta TaxID=863751 RepID=UPI0034CDCE38